MCICAGVGDGIVLGTALWNEVACMSIWQAVTGRIVLGTEAWQMMLPGFAFYYYRWSIPPQGDHMWALCTWDR
jgi:hypothetical protein